MKALTRLLMPLIGYLCAGTVVSAALGYGYLRHSGKLTDETLFRMTAMIHGVDLEKLAEAKEKSADETPPEETSYEEQQDQFQTSSLQFDAKRKQLADSLTDFDYQLKRLSVATTQYDMLRHDVENYLKQQRDRVGDAALQQVRIQIEALVPKKQAKPILVRMIEDNRIDEVILLLGSMNKRTQEAILRSFDSPPEDLDMLYRIQKKMLAGEPVKPFIDSQLESLKQLKQQDK
jgi:hypothetical protein